MIEPTKSGKSRPTCYCRRSGTVVEDGKLPKHLTRAHGGQQTVPLTHLQRTLWKKKKWREKRRIRFWNL